MLKEYKNSGLYSDDPVTEQKHRDRESAENFVRCHNGKIVSDINCQDCQNECENAPVEKCTACHEADCICDMEDIDPGLLPDQN